MSTGWRCTRKTIRCSESCTKSTVAWHKYCIENSTIFKNDARNLNVRCCLTDVITIWPISWDEFIKKFVKKGIKLKWSSECRESSSRVLHLMSDKMVLHFKMIIKTRALKCKIECWPKAFHARSIFKIKKQCVMHFGTNQMNKIYCIFVLLMIEIMGYVSGSCYYLQVNKS